MYRSDGAEVGDFEKLTLGEVGGAGQSNGERFGAFLVAERVGVFEYACAGADALSAVDFDAMAHGRALYPLAQAGMRYEG